MNNHKLTKYLLDLSKKLSNNCFFLCFLFDNLFIFVSETYKKVGFKYKTSRVRRNVIVKSASHLHPLKHSRMYYKSNKMIVQNRYLPILKGCGLDDLHFIGICALAFLFSSPW